jgi:PAS domain S-box-containing protein
VFCFVAGDSTVASITPNARQVLGEACDRAADLRLTLAELIQPEDRHALEDWVGRAWLSEPPPPYVLPTRGPDSGRRWIQLVTPGRVALYDQETILVEIREVTEDTEHRNHARLLARALDTGTDAAWITDLDGRFEYVNGTFERLFGYRAAEVLGRPVSLLSSGRHRTDFFTSMWESIGAGIPYSGEVTNRRSDGGLCTIDLAISKLPGDQLTPARYVAVGRDITSRPAGIFHRSQAA